MPRVFAVANQKGGVGKTSTVVNLSAALGRRGFRVLMIDCDAQGHVSKTIGFETEDVGATLYDIFTSDVDIRNVIYPSRFANLHLIPSNTTLAAVEVVLARKPEKEFILCRALEPVQDQYDFIFIDCPPFLGTLNINAFVSSTSVMATCAMSYLSLEGVNSLLDLAAVINESLDFDRKVRVGCVLATMYNDRLKISRQVYKELHRYFKERLFETRIPVSPAIGDAQASAVPVVQYAPNSLGALAYNRLAEELLEREGLMQRAALGGEEHPAGPEGG